MKAKKIVYAGLSVLLMIAAACNGKKAVLNNTGNEEPGSVENADTTLLPPVETGQANADYKPAFRGQTRIGGVKTVSAYKTDKIAKGLGSPWAVIPMPGGRLLVTEKSGYMLILDTNGSVIKKITGFPVVENAGQGGMLDVALDPGTLAG